MASVAGMHEPFPAFKRGESLKAAAASAYCRARATNMKTRVIIVSRAIETRRF